MNIKKIIATAALGAAAAGAVALGAGTASAEPVPTLVNPCYQIAVAVPGLIGHTPVGPPVELISVFQPVEVVGDGQYVWATAPTGQKVLLTRCQ